MVSLLLLPSHLLLSVTLVIFLHCAWDSPALSTKYSLLRFLAALLSLFAVHSGIIATAVKQKNHRKIIFMPSHLFPFLYRLR